MTSSSVSGSKPSPSYDDVVLGRRSIRGFLRKPVPRELVQEVLSIALRAPSSLNTQPWNFYVVSGAPLDAIRAENTRRNLAGVPPSREPRNHGEYTGVHRERQVEIAKQLFAAMDIPRNDKAKRTDWVLRGFRQFDAPVSIVVTYDRTILGGDIGPFDCGAVVNALVNAAWSRGLGCVINSQGIMQTPVVREFAKIPQDQVVMICVAMGWPDEIFPANAVVSKRKGVDECATFIGFDDGEARKDGAKSKL
ncbi:nitroreductase family protein [Gonapodya prolifera JEL478]|uniref:Nitroreductase family protein n=1 Tax=Gonapodya prolifera (strain JEL478) TaxID=1344416 RepID=A0A138ZY08_GONPJ|nr:nitroreductase family protein [Gonapodya prolifera JEL478]|eukprot:KXS09388.1 nitroreductase family protein [Gonapodya prolifera JEL478]